MRPEQRCGAVLPGVASSEGARLGGDAARRLARTGQYEIGPGLTDAEFARIEGDYGFEFADRASWRKSSPAPALARAAASSAPAPVTWGA